MRGNTHHLRRTRLIVAAASAAALLAVSALGMRPAKVEIAPSTVVLSVQAGEIDALTYLSDTMLFKARRSGASGPFTVQISYSDGRAPQQCVATLDLDEVLRRIVDIQVKRQLSPAQAEAEFPIRLGTLQLEERMQAGKMPPFTVRTGKDRSAIVLVYDTLAVETGTAPEVFMKLAAGCAALAAW